MDKGSKDALTLIRMPRGGYLVMDAPSPARDRYDMHQMHYACTSIEEALRFIRDAVKPTEPEQGPAVKEELTIARGAA